MTCNPFVCQVWPGMGVSPWPLLVIAILLGAGVVWAVAKAFRR